MPAPQPPGSEPDAPGGPLPPSPGGEQPAAAEQLLSDREQAESLARIERGEIPLGAERRLQKLRSEGGLFTSDLSVSEFMLGSHLGLQPLTQVMGSCVYQVGWQYTRELIYSRGLSLYQELDVITEAFNEARGRALSRMSQEAQLAGADAVVGVRLRNGRYDWAADSVEFAVFGTAVRDPTASRRGEAVLTDLSLQDYWKLKQAGVEPCGLVAATSCFFVATSPETQMMSGLAGRFAFPENQELVAYTQGVYAARETALGRLTEQVRDARGDGVVGVNITHTIGEQEMKTSIGGAAVQGLLVTFHVAGTAVCLQPDTPTYPPETTVSLSN